MDDLESQPVPDSYVDPAFEFNAPQWIDLNSRYA